MDELIKKELLSQLEIIRDYVCELKGSQDEIVTFECVCAETLVFDVNVKVEWEICDYFEFNDECDFNYGELINWELESAIAYDEDGNKFEVDQETINLFNEKI